MVRYPGDAKERNQGWVHADLSRPVPRPSKAAMTTIRWPLDSATDHWLAIWWPQYILHQTRWGPQKRRIHPSSAQRDGVLSLPEDSLVINSRPSTCGGSTTGFVRRQRVTTGCHWRQWGSTRRRAALCSGGCVWRRYPWGLHAWPSCIVWLSITNQSFHTSVYLE